MSIVTNVIITCSVSENIPNIIHQLSNFNCCNGRPFNIVSVDDDKLPKGWYGGSKMLEAGILIGAYNMLDIVQFRQALKSVKWVDKDAVLVLINEQMDLGFKLLEIDFENS